ncbi:MAG: oxaloacetate decarboxylase subunit alpha [Zetaproteobacteria bacterium CG12_big_fil_rev_8_21_14_0_65_54_13]|nr:MAG: oxaloacetate decarboxylase subunit alpha [Zetaproteobacteria bacterium CG23_combo_of_CG06-09_8_20_14_all_54_7]PIW51275.1 MAG: oxaloacetate decarboxylase subunit alpha [Zetaproteobacteria bacterium CG12_big_fil_rev_8_21_14_0_65_54_13]PIX55842.1 MAG: oxaloacetate decarboxylase subunit alpha [Zetaproteobacteria bacterium CG_4_10_14_3_um_filter_54_28]PJA30528.1 MAG: oxaloacetate decarboxylase subunit alpha [Zetaproteobacteria bacterium CG_4_9_14_3_um_filter_54_145]
MNDVKKKLAITELALRDGHQSLLATRMRLDDMLPICEKLDAIGYWSIEAWGGATFDTCLRYLKEGPWVRLRELNKALPNTPIQMLLRGQNLLGYRHYADDVVKKFVDMAAANGVDVFRVFDAMNDLRNVRTAVNQVKANGKHAEGTICYTTSPVHTLEYLVDLGKGFEDMGCDTLAIKDMAGLLTPTATRELILALKKEVAIPLHLHSHATAGVAEMVQWEAVHAGCDIIDTAISPLAGGTSHPPTEAMVAAFAGTEYDTGLNLVALQEIAAYFKEVRKKYSRFESDSTGVDTRVFVNQIPGGMISNLANQLRDQGELDKMDAVLDEIPRVRKDFGYPPLVTPTSQIVGTQAVLNVISGKKYKVITNETRDYLKGLYGRALGEINEDVRKLAIGDEEPVDIRPADLLKPEMDALTREIGDKAKSVEDVLSYALFPTIALEFFEERACGVFKPESLDTPVKESGTPEFINPPSLAPTEFNITIHGEQYHIKIEGSGHKSDDLRPFYVKVDNVLEEVTVETLTEVVPTQNGNIDVNKASKGSRRPKAVSDSDVTTPMPGRIVAINFAIGDHVDAGATVLTVEAMKMENQVHAPVSGTITAIHVAIGDTVNPDECLVEIN